MSAAGIAFIKSPAEFAFGDDIDLFLEKFHSFAEATKCEAKGRFDLFKSYLDDRSFRRVQALVFEEGHKTSDAVDMSKEEVKALIRGALIKEPLVPERISLKFRVQSETEEIEDFGDEIRLLGQKVHGKDRAETNEMVIEAFCAGVRDTALASKLLSKKFEDLTSALNFAVARRETTNIKKVLNTQRASTKTGDISLFPSGAARIESTDRVVERPAPRSGSPSRPGSQSHGNSYNGAGQQDTRRCYRCDGIGHFQRFCRASPSRPGPSQASGYNGAGQHDTRRCYRCNSIGHVQRFCRASLASSPSRGASPGQIVCYQCGDFGHIRANCRSRGVANRNFRSRPGFQGQASRSARPAQ